MTAPATPWTGLGQRAGSRPADSTPPDDEHDDRPFQHRIIPAAGAPSVLPPNPVVSPFAMFRTGGSAGTATDTTAADNQEGQMPKTEQPAARRKPRLTKAASPRFQICALLMAKGDLTMDEIRADVSGDAKAISNGFTNGKTAGHLRVTSTGKWHITEAGIAWTGSGANLDNHKAASSSPREVKRSRRQPREKGASLPASEKKRLGVVDLKRNGSPKPLRNEVAVTETAQVHLVQERSFRCGTFNDGGFVLSKNGVQIELTAAEHHEMLRYEERMAEEQA